VDALSERVEADVSYCKAEAQLIKTTASASILFGLKFTLKLHAKKFNFNQFVV